MKINTIGLTFSTLVAFANAAQWKFNVVSIKNPTFEMGLKYNNKILKMTAETFPLFTTTIESGSTKSYKYVVLDKNGKVVEEESIQRTYTPEVSSINEVYNRKNKLVDIASLPKVYEPIFNGYQDKIKEFDDSKIYSVYAYCDDSAYTYLKHSPFLSENKKNEATANCTVSLITPSETYKAKGTIQLIGFDSRRYKKLSWKLKLNKKIFGRKTLKLRANANDVSFMRDKLSTELYKSLGVPTYSSAYARLIINNDVYGLYSLVDNVGKNWIAAAIHGNDDAHVGYNYKTYAGASLKYLGTGNKAWNIGSYEIDEVDASDAEANGNDWYRLAHFTKLYEDWDKQYGNDQSKAAVDALEKFFNLESLLRQMVIESLTFAYDNFWANSGNYAIYYNPEQMKYQINPYDFDGSFYGFRDSLRFQKDYLTNPIDCINWADNARKDGDTYFVSKLFKHDIIKNRYNKIMSDTVNKVFNVPAISPLIDTLSDLIEEDIDWNFGLIDDLDSQIPGYVNHYTLQNFKDNTNFKMLSYKPKLYRNEAEYGLKHWIQLRGDECSIYVKNVGVKEEEEEDEEIKNSAETNYAAPPISYEADHTITTTIPVKPTTTTQIVLPTTITTTVAPIQTTTTPVTTKNTTTTTATKKVKTVKKKVVVKKTKYVTKYVGKN